MTIGCRDASLAAGEPLAGTAPLAQCWVVIEQPGPWGRQALTESHLDPALGSALLEASEGTGTRILLARHADRPERSGHASRHVWIAHTAPGACVLLHTELDDPDRLRGWDFAAMARGELPAVGEAKRDPVLFICTNGSRDACCAIHGLALANAVADRVPAPKRSQVWQCSHLGGHRFAPTALALPSGNVYGRVTADTAVSILADEAADRIHGIGYRGRSSFAAPLQAAEAAIRSLGIDERDSLDVLWVRGDVAIPVPSASTMEHIASMLTEVRHVDGRAWRVEVRHEPLGTRRPESCGSDPVDTHAWRVRAITQAVGWR